MNQTARTLELIRVLGGVTDKKLLEELKKLVRDK
jgi:hypothetical protein